MSQIPTPASAASGKSDDNNLPVLPRGLTPPPLPPPDHEVRLETQPDNTVQLETLSDITPLTYNISKDSGIERLESNNGKFSRLANELSKIEDGPEVDR
jgi:hypothetical protein